MSKEEFSLPAFVPEPPMPEPTARNSRKKKSDPIPDLRLDVGLPANIDAEKTILGAVLLDNDAFLEASEKLIPNDFSLDSHRRIFLRMTELMDAKYAVDIVTLANELSTNKEIEAIGGVAYLASLTEGLPRRPVIEDYIRIVKDKSMLREIMGVSSMAIAKAADQSETALEIAGNLSSELEQVVSTGIQSGLKHVSDISVEVMDKFITQSTLTQSPGFSYGVPAMNEATGGIQEGEQVVVGCFSGVGKTTLLAQITAANCPANPLAMFLIEPTRHDFLRRLWSIVGDVRYTAVTKPWLATKEERDRLMWAQAQVMEWPLYIYDQSNLTLEEQQAMARLAMHRHGVLLYGIDYLQRMKVKAIDKSEDTRLKVGRASTANADLVKSTKCRSVLLSQLGRAGGMSAIPTMDRLRESGQIENDASTVVLMHLKYDEEQGHFTDEGAAIIPKQRFGIPCNVKLYKDQRTALWCSGKKEDNNQSQEQRGLNWS